MTERLHERTSGRPRPAFVALVASALSASAACADQAAIKADLKVYLRSASADERAAIVTRIESDADYAPSRLSGWLHDCGVFEARPPGLFDLESRSAGGELRVTVRVPFGYDPFRPSPLIYALHGTGGDGPGFIEFIVRMLGRRADDYLIAAPSGYRQIVIKSSEPYDDEHRAALAAVRKAVHVDSDRVYAVGYSRGGHACWTLAICGGGDFAGVMPLAGSLLIPEYDKLFEVLLPNSSVTSITGIWGALDSAGPDGATAGPLGGIAAVNRLIFEQCRSLKLEHRGIERPDLGHGGIVPTETELAAFLSARRDRTPKSYRHVFRVTAQGRSPWVDVIRRTDAEWDDKPLELSLRSGEDGFDPAVQREALARAIRGRLSEIRYERGEQAVRVDRRNVKSLVVWLGDEMFDWERPVQLRFSGRTVFDQVPRRSLELCLEQARRSGDFDRLRWAGLICDSGSKARICPADFDVNDGK